MEHSDSLLALLIKLLKPCGKLILRDTSDVSTALKLNGFLNVTKTTENNYIAEKPKFEVRFIFNLCIKMTQSYPIIYCINIGLYYFLL